MDLNPSHLTDSNCDESRRNNEEAAEVGSSQGFVASVEQESHVDTGSNASSSGSGNSLDSRSDSSSLIPLERADSSGSSHGSVHQRSGFFNACANDVDNDDHDDYGEDRGSPERANFDSIGSSTSFASLWSGYETHQSGKRKRFAISSTVRPTYMAAYDLATKKSADELFTMCNQVVGFPIGADVSAGERLSEHNQARLKDASKPFDAFLRGFKADIGTVERCCVDMAETFADIGKDLPPEKKKVFQRSSLVAFSAIRACVLRITRKRQELLSSSWGFSLPQPTRDTLRHPVESEEWRDLLKTYQEARVLEQKVNKGKRPAFQGRPFRGRGGRQSGRGRGPHRGGQSYGSSSSSSQSSFAQPPAPCVQGRGRGRGG
jgi:hypothetical protein